jgi:hypothetical protein
MKSFLKSAALLTLSLGGLGASADLALAHGSHEARVYVEVYRIPRGDWLNVRQWPNPNAPKVGQLWNGDVAVLDLNDCWDARWDERIPARHVNFNGPAVWCGVRAGHHGSISGYVRTSFVHLD